MQRSMRGSAAWGLLGLCGVAQGLTPMMRGGLDRRAALQQTVASGLALAGLATRPALAAAGPEEELLDVYFGCGCFWHVQHEFIELEKSLLRRDGPALTARTGYAGGKRVGDAGRVCYHNFANIADYGRLGHGEVVSMQIPAKHLEAFAKQYFDLFVPYKIPGVQVYGRPDFMDKGPEYRSLMGIKGGVKSPHFATIEKANSKGLKLLPGNGNDPDTLGNQSVYVMDSDNFPFYVGEFYHQFHNDFLSAPYPRQYNNLANVLLDAGKLGSTGCPDKI